ncbi:MAG: sensor histidine kinase [Nitrosopumilus sp.]|nr:MAG: sensor histidine kinase [Nitrosopumilus sp.]
MTTSKQHELELMELKLQNSVLTDVNRFLIQKLKTSPDLNYVHEVNELKQELRLTKEISDYFEKINDKLQFIPHILSHELKTPLVPILSYSELLQNGSFGKLNDVQKEKLSIVLNSVSDLNKLFDKFVLTQKIESKTFEPEISKVNLFQHLQKIIDDSFEHNNPVELNCSPKIDILCDSELFKIIIKEIFDNAIKVSEKPNIHVNCKVNDNNVRIFIKNDGPKIPEYELEKIFQKFYQVDMDLTRNVPGLGLGLFICKNLVNMQKGKIMAKNSENGMVIIITMVVI